MASYDGYEAMAVRRYMLVYSWLKNSSSSFSQCIKDTKSKTASSIFVSCNKLTEFYLLSWLYMISMKPWK